MSVKGKKPARKATKKTASKQARKVAKKSPAVVDEHGLSVQQRRFADFYLIGKPAGRAYEMAGYAVEGGTADSNAWRLLRNEKVSAYVREMRRRAAESAMMEREELVGFLCSVIRTAPDDVSGGSPLAQEFQTEETEIGSRTKVRMVGKIEAAKQLAQMLGWNEPEKAEVKFEVVIGGNQEE